MTRTALAWLCCALPIAAQTAVVSPPACELTTVGPAGWRQRLGPTNLGSLLASAAGRALWSDGAEQLEGIWRHLLGVEGAAFAAARQRLLDYGGTVHVALRLVGDRRHQPMTAAIAFGPDGRTDMAALTADLRSLLAGLAEQPWQTITVGDVEVQSITRDQETLLAPWLHDGRILMAMTPAADLAAARAEVLAMPAPSALRPDALAMSLRFDMPAILAATNAGNNAKELAALGANALRTIELHCGAAGPHIVLEPRLVFGDGDRGLLGALFPAAKAPSTFLIPMPTEASWKAGHVDLVALWLAGEKLVAAFSDEPPEAVRKKSVDELGIDPIDDILAFAATDYLLTGAFDRLLDGGAADVTVRDAAARRREVQDRLHDAAGQVEAVPATRGDDHACRHRDLAVRRHVHR
ncbi:MAG: hypothetical protein IPK26_04500 [Planctomycetes bacterium]|nr:hypothetical protein [Planctomycetota bacterium]